MWVDYAKKNVLLYQLPSNPADVDLSKIPPKENVFLRGLGLSFFDYVGLFTVSRGGASRTKRENWSIIHQARNRLYTVDQEEPLLPSRKKSKARRSNGMATVTNKRKPGAMASVGIFDWRNIFDYLKKTLSCFITRKSSKNITCRFQRKILSMIFSPSLQRSVSESIQH